MIEAEYTISYADYKAANWVYLRHRRWAMVGYIFWIWIVPTCGVCALASALWYQTHSGLGAIDQSGVIILDLWLILAFPLIRWVQLRRCYRALFPKGVPKIARITVNEDQVISAIPDRNEGRFYWKSIADYAEDKNGMILFVSKKRYLLLPHHALDEAQWAEMRGLIAAKVPRS